MNFLRYPDYKDFETEWLGDVPTHWNVAPIESGSEFRNCLSALKHTRPAPQRPTPPTSRPPAKIQQPPKTRGSPLRDHSNRVWKIRKLRTTLSASEPCCNVEIGKIRTGAHQAVKLRQKMVQKTQSAMVN